MKGTRLISIWLIFILVSCTDASIVSGLYNGKMYASDTLNVTITVSEVNKNYIKIDMIDSLDQQFIHFVSLTKTGNNAYDLDDNDPLGIAYLHGYYFEGFMNFYYSNGTTSYWVQSQKK